MIGIISPVGVLILQEGVNFFYEIINCLIGVIVPVRALNLQDGGHCFYEIVNLYDRGQWSCGGTYPPGRG
jgi:hypothetical protein